MSDFDEDFDRYFKNRERRFNLEWERAARQARIYGYIGLALGLLILGFLAWVVIVLLKFIGAI